MKDWVAVFWKAMATLFVWVLGGGVITILSIFVAEIVGEDILVGIILITIGMILSSGFIWSWGRVGDSGRKKNTASLADELDSVMMMRTKRKNADISRRLRDYSDEDLLDLRERVASGDLTETELAQLLG